MDDRYLVIENKQTGEKFRLAPKDMPVPDGFGKITGTIPIPEKLKHYRDLPIYKKNKYFQIQEPYYALIKAKSLEEAIEFYTETVAEDEENTLEDEIKELDRVTALGVYVNSICNATVEEVKKKFSEEGTDLLLLDSALL